MKRASRAVTSIVVLTLLLASLPIAAAESNGAAGNGPVIVTGTSACAQCEGIATGHDIAIKVAGGLNIVIKGQGDDYKAIHKVRGQGKTIAATLAGPLEARTNDKGQPYLEGEAASVQLASDPTPVTVSGTSACAQCEGIADKGHDVALMTDASINFVLKGQGSQYDSVHKVRKQGVPITAILAGPIVPKENAEGFAYLEAQVLSIQVSEPVTISGTSACAQCEGIAKGHDVALKTASGLNFVLKGQGDDYKQVHQVRGQGKKITAVCSGPVTGRTNDDGEPYFEVQVSSVEIDS